jgi:hypothetical protein
MRKTGVGAETTGPRQDGHVLGCRAGGRGISSSGPWGGERNHDLRLHEMGRRCQRAEQITELQSPPWKHQVKQAVWPQGEIRNGW